MALADPGYEYDAPRFYDFKREDDGVSMASRWFDGHEDDAPGMRSPLAEAHNAMNQATSKKAEAPASVPAKGNLVTSWGGAATAAAAARKRTRADEAPQKPASQATKGAHPERGCRSVPPVTRTSTRISGEEGAAAKKEPASKKARKVESAPRRQSQRIKALVSKASSAAAPTSGTRGSRSQKQQAGAAGSKHSGHLKMAAAVGKRAMSTHHASAKGSSARLTRVLQTRKVLPARSTKPLTLPEDVCLHTSMRLGDPSEAAAPQGTPFKALAEKVVEFHKKTPMRYRSKPGAPPEHGPLSMTEPKAPSLMTATRSRPTYFKSHEEEELQELEAMPKFKATKLNTSVLLGSGQLHLPTERELQITQPQPFVFVTDDRAERRRQRAGAGGQEEGSPAAMQSFKAQPLDRSILEGPAFVPTRGKRHSTIPKSPMLQTKLRAKEAPPSLYGLDERRNHEFHARPVPQYLSVPREFFSQQLAAHREVPPPTQPAPFSLRTEQRGKHYEQALKARVDSESKQAQRARIPRAQPLPLSTDVPMVPPRPEARSLTVPQPFGLRSEARHQEYLEEHSEQLRAEEAARKQAATFAARPLPNLDAVYRVHESDRPLTVPEELELATDARAAERAVFDQAVGEKIRLNEEQRQLEEAAKAAADRRDVRELRKRLVVPARPVPDFSRPFMAMPSAKPLTNPKTPKLGKKSKRARNE